MIVRSRHGANSSNETSESTAVFSAHTVTGLMGSEETASDTSTCTLRSKKPRYACIFHPDSNQFTWARVLSKGPSFAYCTICSCNINVVYGGKKDLNKYGQTHAGSRGVTGDKLKAK